MLRPLPALITLTEAAAARIRDIEAEATAPDGQRAAGKKLLRLSLSTKGCSGLSYEMEWVEAPLPTDDLITDQGVSFAVDRKATVFLAGTVMDFTDNDLESGFSFNNPNEKGRCGCGKSFHT